MFSELTRGFYFEFANGWRICMMSAHQREQNRFVVADVERPDGSIESSQYYNVDDFAHLMGKVSAYE